MNPAERPKILCLGNCQSRFLAEALRQTGQETVFHRCLQTTFPSRARSHPLFHELSRFLPEQELEKMFEEHALLDLPRKEDLAGLDCRAVVVNLFHEAPLVESRDGAYTAFVNAARLAVLERHAPAMARHIREEFESLSPSHDTYLERFLGMLQELRALFPEQPIFLLKRLSHHPAFDPEPHSYLHCWARQWRRFPAVWRAWTQAVPNLHLLDMDQVLATIRVPGPDGVGEPNGSDASERPDESDGLDGLFLLYRLNAEDPTPSTPPRLDLEHLDDAVWSGLARRLLAILEQGAPADHLPWQPPSRWLQGPKWWNCGSRAIDTDAAAGRARKALVRILAAGPETHFGILTRHESKITFSYKTVDLFQKTLQRFPNKEAITWYARNLLRTMEKTLPSFSRNYSVLFAERVERQLRLFHPWIGPAERRRLEERVAFHAPSVPEAEHIPSRQEG